MKKEANTNIKLLLQAIVKYILGIVMIGLLLFVPSGTFEFWNAWLLIGLLFIPMFIVMIVLWKKTPELLEKRLNGKEKEKEQKHVILISLILFIIAFAIAGLDFKYEWSKMPAWVISFSIFLVFPFVLVKRIKNEEKVLEEGLEGYKEYKEKVKYKMLPYIW